MACNHSHEILTLEDQELKFNALLKLADREEIPKDLNNLRKFGLRAMIKGLNAVLPEHLLPSKIHLDSKSITIGHETISRSEFSEIIIVGGGKATGGMCAAVIKILGDKIPFKGVINIPYHQPFPNKMSSPNGKSSVEVIFAGHPVPDEAGLKGVEKMLKIIADSPKNALILTLISGGGSALMPYPAEGITLAEKQQVNRILLQCGASIQEINCIRKHLSRFKGGQLSKFAFPRRVFSLIISDVLGNDLQTIASGPTVPDLTSFMKVDDICNKYKIYEKLPDSVKRRIIDGLGGKIPETPKPDPLIFDETTNLIIGSAEISAEITEADLLTNKITAQIYTDTLQGEASAYGEELAEMLPKFQAAQFPAAFIGTGEFTVTIKGKGKGGRNQEMLLGFLKWLHDHPEADTHKLCFVIISGAFDGIEGNSDAMGAIIDSTSLTRAKQLGLDVDKYLNNNNSNEFFQKLGDVLVSGQTGTNVNDLTLILINQS